MISSINIDKDVAILGGGCAGILLGDELAQQGASCAVVDTLPYAAYASTRNQGWLQSGAFYAAYGKDEGHRKSAHACKEGYRELRAFVEETIPYALHTPTDSYMLFGTPSADPANFKAEDDREQREALEQCDDLEIDAEAVDIGELANQEPVLRGTPLTHAIRITDRPMDTNLLLRAIATRAEGHGVLFQPVSALSNIDASWDGYVWTLRLGDGNVLRVKSIVLACGVYIPTMLERLGIPEAIKKFDRTKVPVLVVHKPIAHSMLVLPRVDLGPNIVPFYRPGS
ncbi:MAG TPA: FAD-dependent oxidoreductase, partial [Chloroflexia bacterium]